MPRESADGKSPAPDRLVERILFVAFALGCLIQAGLFLLVVVFGMLVWQRMPDFAVTPLLHMIRNVYVQFRR